MPDMGCALEIGRLRAESVLFYGAVEKLRGIKIEYTFAEMQEVLDHVHEKGLVPSTRRGGWSAAGSG